jgi:hypothetical protein
MKNWTKKIGPIELRKSQIYTLRVVVATLDCITKQCCEVNTDGEETQEQISFTVWFTAL